MASRSTIRVRKTTDTQLVKQLDRKVFSKNDAKIKLEDTHWWVAHDGATPVGYAGLRPLTNGEPFVYFTRAGVIYAARGQGLHRRLIRARLAWTRRHGFKGAMTYTLSDNLDSANNLIRLGFELFTPSYRWVEGGCLYFFREV